MSAVPARIGIMAARQGGFSAVQVPVPLVTGLAPLPSWTYVPTALDEMQIRGFGEETETANPDLQLSETSVAVGTPTVTVETEGGPFSGAKWMRFSHAAGVIRGSARVRSPSGETRISFGDFTMEDWRFSTPPTPAGGGMLMVAAIAAGGFSLRTLVTSEKLTVRVLSASLERLIYESTTRKNEWNHYALVKSGSTLTLFINGKPASSASGFALSELSPFDESFESSASTSSPAFWQSIFIEPQQHSSATGADLGTAGIHGSRLTLAPLYTGDFTPPQL
jgi:hypothetical protein